MRRREMVATIGTVGSEKFRYKVGTKKECQAWLDKVWAKRGPYTNESSIVSNKEAKLWRYQDGSYVIEELDARVRLDELEYA
jgi:hypothetical protein